MEAAPAMGAAGEPTPAVRSTASGLNLPFVGRSGSTVALLDVLTTAILKAIA